ncbi:MAG TPA: HAD family hydrolase [Candidatus Eisenbacteria bacterium]|nr:HAD family hydrolase [Candidatus Eisenbacteria bacterium]
MLRAVIFDLGNTLAGLDPSTPSTRTDYADVVARPGAERMARHLAERGILTPKAAGERYVERFLEIRERNRRTADQTGREIPATTSVAESLADAGAAGAGLSSEAIEGAVRVLFEFEEARIVRLPGAFETLEAVKSRGIPMALLSNATDGPYIARVAARLGIRDYFDPFVVSADIGVRKPRSEAFWAVLEKWSFTPEAVAMVGDSLFHDVDGANRMGLISVHLTQVPNTIDPPLRGTIVPRLEVPSHEALREALVPLLDGAGA